MKAPDPVTGTGWFESEPNWFKTAIFYEVYVRGFNDALKENPGAKLLASQPGNYQRLQALQVMENLMQSNSQIDGVLAANDAMAVGAIEALDGASRQWLAKEDDVGAQGAATSRAFGRDLQSGIIRHLAPLHAVIAAQTTYIAVNLDKLA